MLCSWTGRNAVLAAGLPENWRWLNDKSQLGVYYATLGLIQKDVDDVLCL